MPKTRPTPTAAEVYIAKRRRAYPSLFWNDDDVLLHLLGMSAHDVAWDENGNIQDLRGEPRENEESFTEKGWDYMENASDGRMRTNWEEPVASSPLVRIPENISEAWERQIWSLCRTIARLSSSQMESWIEAHYSFQTIGDEYKRAETKRNFEAFVKVKAALALTQQRLEDIRTLRRTQSLAQTKPTFVTAGVLVHHKDFASTDTATVVQTCSMPVGENESSQVAILDRPLRGSLVLRLSDLVPLTHPPALSPA